MFVIALKNFCLDTAGDIKFTKKIINAKGNSQAKLKLQ